MLILTPFSYERRLFRMRFTAASWPLAQPLGFFLETTLHIISIMHCFLNNFSIYIHYFQLNVGFPTVPHPQQKNLKFQHFTYISLTKELGADKFSYDIHLTFLIASWPGTFNFQMLYFNLFLPSIFQILPGRQIISHRYPVHSLNAHKNRPQHVWLH